MTLEQATRLALTSATAGDLDGLAQALQARSEAIAAGGIATPELVAMGQKVLDLLQGLIRSGVMECARLGQIQAGLVRGLDAPPHIDYLA